jgi:hypothetical protein
MPTNESPESGILTASELRERLYSSTLWRERHLGLAEPDQVALDEGNRFHAEKAAAERIAGGRIGPRQIPDPSRACGAGNDRGSVETGHTNTTIVLADLMLVAGTIFVSSGKETRRRHGLVDSHSLDNAL